MINHPWASSETATGEIILTVPIAPAKILGDGQYLQLKICDERAVDRLIYELMRVKFDAFRSKPPIL